MSNINIIKYKKIKCPICNSSIFKTINKREKKIYLNNKNFLFKNFEVGCQNCFFVYVNPTPKKKDLNNYYSSKQLNFLNPDYNVGNTIKFLKKYAGNKRNIVEYGSGAGHFINLARLNNFNAYGIDPGFKNKYTKNSISEIKRILFLKNKEIEIVYLNHVLEHISEPKYLLKEIYDNTSNNSLLIIEVPDLNKYLNTNNYCLTVEHLSHFSIASLSNLLSCCGFKIILNEKKLLSRDIGLRVIAQKKILKNINLQIEKKYINIFKKSILKSLKKNDLILKFFKNIIEDKNNSKILLWGMNSIMYENINQINKKYFKKLIFFDSNKKLNTIKLSDSKSFKVYNKLKDIKKIRCDKIIICSISWKDEIFNELINIGILKKNIKVIPSI